MKWRGEIFNGTVRYTGGLVARTGDWVGVELDERGEFSEKGQMQNVYPARQANHHVSRNEAALQLVNFNMLTRVSVFCLRCRRK